MKELSSTGCICGEPGPRSQASRRNPTMRSGKTRSLREVAEEFDRVRHQFEQKAPYRRRKYCAPRLPAHNSKRGKHCPNIDGSGEFVCERGRRHPRLELCSEPSPVTTNAAPRDVNQPGTRA